MIQIGDSVPDMELRTDEGTPLSLADLKGRALVVYLLGEMFTPTVERLLHVLAEYTPRFLAIGMSPVAVLGETAEQLAEFRDRNDMPFIMISDEAMALHQGLRGTDGDRAGVWVINKRGVVIEIIPSLPPTELVTMSVERARRAAIANSRKEEERMGG